MRFFSFSLLIGAGAVLGHLYLYRLVRQVTARTAWRVGLGTVLLAMTTLLLLRRPIRDIGPEVERAYELVAYSWMALALGLVFALAAADVSRATAAVLGWFGRFARGVAPSPEVSASGRPPGALEPGAGAAASSEVAGEGAAAPPPSAIDPEAGAATSSEGDRGAAAAPPPSAMDPQAGAATTSEGARGGAGAPPPSAIDPEAGAAASSQVARQDAAVLPSSVTGAEPARGSERPEAPAGLALGRRDLVTRALPWAALGGGASLAAYGALSALVPPEVTEVELRLPRLPRRLEGLTIAQLTDVHVGPFIRRPFIDALVREVNATRPDVVVITGDLVDGDVRTLGHAVAGLANLRSRFGTFFVTGNHEYYSGVGPWVRFLEGLGVTVLRNRHHRIGDRGASIDLVGVDDWSGARRRGGQAYDLDAALAGRDPERAAVLLAHQPSNFEVAAAKGVGLQISGHTHGGQIFPMTALIGLGWRYTRGLYRQGESHIYVSRGCGFWGPPARLGSPPEIVRYALTV